jgi:PadR family transcriptional regulator PadR
LLTKVIVEYDREFLTGTVGVLILSLLAEREMYGYEMLQEAERRSARAFQLKEGTLYPALHQMERAGLLKARWRDSEAGRARKYYSLTARGRRQAASKRRQWTSIATAMRAILGHARA